MPEGDEKKETKPVPDPEPKGFIELATIYVIETDKAGNPKQKVRKLMIRANLAEAIKIQ